MVFPCVLPYCNVPGLTKSDPMYCKAIDVLEKQDRILAERSNKCIRADIALMARGGDLGDNQLVFPITGESSRYQPLFRVADFCWYSLGESIPTSVEVRVHSGCP